MPKKDESVTFFTIQFYVNSEAGQFGVHFVLDGTVLTKMENSELAADCQDAALRARVIIEDLFADGAALYERIIQSDRFVEAETTEQAQAVAAKEGH